MGKQLYIIRHAKSDWAFQVSDFDRPLNERGFENAPKMAERISSPQLMPEFLISSPAKRALTTAQIFADIFNYPNRMIATETKLYEANVSEILAVINNLDDDFQRIALFAHNPGLSEIVSYLTQNDYINLPTCSIVQLDFPHADHWAEISQGTGIIINFLYPKDGKSEIL